MIYYINTWLAMGQVFCVFYYIINTMFFAHSLQEYFVDQTIIFFAYSLNSRNILYYSTAFFSF